MELLALTGLEQSKGAAKRAVQGGGIYLNNERVTGLDRAVTMADSIDGQFVVLRKGRKKYHLVQVLA